MMKAQDKFKISLIRYYLNGLGIEDDKMEIHFNEHNRYLQVVVFRDVFGLSLPVLKRISEIAGTEKMRIYGVLYGIDPKDGTALGINIMLP